MKCNHCGAMLSSFQAVCPECGYEISTNRSNASINELFTLLDDEEKSYAQEVARQGTSDRARLIRLERAHFQRHCSIISNFPVPNETEALMEFLSMGVSHAKGAKKATTSMKGFVIATLLEIIGALLLIPVTMTMVQQCADNKYSHPNVARYEGGKDKQDALIFIVLILVGAIAFTWYLYQKKKEGDKQYTNQNQYDISVAEAWRQKCRQVLVKAKITLANDPVKMAMLKDFENQL